MKTWAVRTRNLALASALAMLFAAAAAPSWAAPGAMAPDQEQRMIRVLSRTPETVLNKLPGMTAESAAKISAWREKNYEFESVAQIKEVAGLPEANWEQLKGAFMKELPKESIDPATEEDLTGPVTGPQKSGAPPAAPAAGAGAKGKKASLGAVKSGQGQESEEPQKLNLSVRGGFYSNLPGYDLSGLPEAQRMAFLEAVNREMCSCGCENETLGYCLVNDPGCPVVKARVRKLYKDLIGSDPVEPKKEAEAKP